MKFIEPDFARTANLFFLFEENDIEILSSEEKENFYFLLLNFLSRLEYKKCSIKLDKQTKNLKIKLYGYSKNDIFIITFNPSTIFNVDLTISETDEKSNSDLINKIKTYFNKFRLEVYIDPLEGLKFKIYKNENNYKKI